MNKQAETLCCFSSCEEVISQTAAYSLVNATRASLHQQALQYLENLAQLVPVPPLLPTDRSGRRQQVGN